MKKNRNGFTLAETLLVLFVICIFTQLFLSLKKPAALYPVLQQVQSFLETAQASAISERTKKTVRINTHSINWENQSLQLPESIVCDSGAFSFNAKGNVSSGGSIRCRNGQEQGKIILQIGPGRIRIEMEGENG